MSESGAGVVGEEAVTATPVAGPSVLVAQAPLLTRVVRAPAFPLAVVVAAVVCGHLTYLLGIFDPNPMRPFSGLASGLRSGLLPGYDTIDPNTGFTSQAFSHRAALDWLGGSVPWWNPAQGLGTPLAGDMKGMAMFLPFVLLLRFLEGQIALYLIFDLIAAVSTYLLLRRLKIASWVSVAAGIAFGLNGTMAWSRYAAADPVCFLPLTILGLELIRDGVRNNKPTRWWVAALAVAMSIYAGFPETAYIDAVVVVVWAVARLSGLDWRQMRRYVAYAGGAGATGLFIAAPVLTALVDYLPNSFLAGHNGGYAHATMPRIGLANLMFPYLYGPIFAFIRAPHAGLAINRFWSNTGGYLTAATVFLALVGLMGSRHRVLRYCIAGVAVLCIGRTFGIGPFVTLFNAIPGMAHVAAYRYSYPAFEFCVIVLAAFGLDSLVRREFRWQRIVAVFVVTLLLAVLAFDRGHTVADVLRTLPGARAWVVASLVWGFATLLVLLVAALVPARIGGRVLLIVLLPLEAVAMFVTPEFSTFRGGSLDFSAVAFLQAHTGLDRVYTLGPLQANYGTYFGINSLNADDLPVPKAFSRDIQTRLDPNTSPIYFTGTKSNSPKGLTPAQALARYLSNYERLGVKYVLVSSGAPAPVSNPTLPLVYHDLVVDIYALPHTRPFYSDASGRCTYRSMSFEKVRLECATATTLTRNELQMPGWSAHVNGRAVPLRADADGVETLAVPAGASTVTFGFEPPHTGLAVFAAILGLAVCAGSGLARRARVMRARRHPLGDHAVRPPPREVSGMPPGSTDSMLSPPEATLH